MIEEIQAIVALDEYKTLSTAANYLRVSQPSLSKRLQALQERVKRPLYEKKGRLLVLTDQGQEFAREGREILASLVTLLDKRSEPPKSFALGASESLMASFLPYLLRDTQFPTYRFQVHRSPLVVRQVEAGVCDLGILVRPRRVPAGMSYESIGQEPMVVVSHDECDLSLPMFVIEKEAATWPSVREAVQGFRHVIHLQSFMTVAQMSRAGLGHGLIPFNVARTLRIPSHRMSEPVASREIGVICQKGRWQQLEPWVLRWQRICRNKFGLC